MPFAFKSPDDFVSVCCFFESDYYLNYHKSKEGSLIKPFSY